MILTYTLLMNQNSNLRPVVAQGFNPIVEMQFYRAKENVNTPLDWHFSSNFDKYRISYENFSTKPYIKYVVLITNITNK